jgi:uncharacterized membrane protein (DUF4010 family)
MASYFYRLIVALGLGVMVGIQRESSYDEPEGRLFAGVRTFGLISLLGYAVALAAGELDSALVFLGGTVALACLLFLAYYADVIEGKPGMTTEIAAVVTFVVGAMCYWDMILLAASMDVIVTLMLALKHEFRSFTHAITREDIYATLKFAVVSVVVLPLLPDKAYGIPPLDVLNPFQIWLMVVFISAISFFGYVLIKVVGPRQGVGLTGLLGGIVSSTAVTLSFAQRSHDEPKLAKPFSLAIIVAWTVMFVRVVVIVLTLEAQLAYRILLPMAAATVVGGGYCLYLYLRQKSYQKEDVEFANPFELGPALKFGMIYAVILLGSKAAQVYFGNTGVYVSSFVSGLADLNAITLSMVDLMQGGGVSMAVAARAIVIAAMANTLFKGGMALATGSPGLRRVLWPALVATVIAGGAAAFLVV